MFSHFERQHEPLISGRRFVVRMAMFAGLALSLDAFLILLGTCGFHAVERLDWIDAALDAALIITGNGPMRAASTFAGKLFELSFAVVGGIGFIVVVTVILAPVVHRVLHAFHLGPPDADSTAP